MKTIVLLIATLLSIPLVRGQIKKNKIIFNLGIQKSDLSHKIFYAETTNGWVTTSQSSTTLVDINLLYEMGLQKSRFMPTFCIGFNQKGFVDKGFNSLSDPFATYFTATNKHSFISLIAGMNYKLFNTKRTNLLIGQYLIPDYNLHHNAIYKAMAFSTKSALILEYSLNPKFILYFSPFYTFSISNYNSKKLQQNSADYRPVSLGINFGLGLQ